MGRNTEIQQKIDTVFIQAEANESRGVAYVIKDPYSGDMEVKASANGWWLNQETMDIIIGGLKEGNSIKTVCAYARVSKAQWQYFNELHPEFAAIVERCRDSQIIRAMDTVNRNLDDPKMARWYLERRHPSFKTKLTLSDVMAPELPGMATNFLMPENSDPEKVAAKLMDLAQTILSEHKSKKVANTVKDAVPTPHS